MRRLTFFFLSMLLVGQACWSVAGTHYFAIDTPAELSGTDYWSHQILQNNNGAYSSVVKLADGLQLGALHRLSNGTWLFSPAFPIEITGTEFEARDIVQYDGAAYSTYLDGDVAGLPDHVRIDSIYVDNSNNLYFSIDTPADLDGIAYSPSDLIFFDGAAFSLFWDSTAAGVPEDTNVIGADVDGTGEIVVSFDVPVTLDNTPYEPGELVRWDGSAFASYSKDVTWPNHAHLSDFAFPPFAGGVSPSGAVPLHVTKAAAGQITITWGPSCSASDVDYEVYAGIIGDYYSHVSLLCTTGGATTATITPDPSHAYYLVVPTNTFAEGSYGENSSGIQRPQGGSACRVQSVGACGM